MERASFIAVIEAPALTVQKFESIGYFTSVFTYGEMVGEYVALNNGNKSFFRASNISVHNLESVFDGLYNETANSDAKAELDPVWSLRLLIVSGAPRGQRLVVSSRVEPLVHKCPA